MTLIGFDFSINKPAACILNDNKYTFISWPYGIDIRAVNAFKEAGITIIDREDDKDKGEGITSQMRYEITNSQYLSNLIRETLKPWLNGNILLGFEGLSYGSRSDVGVQLGAYKYILMDRLSELVPICNMFTYSPITVKSVAGCAKKGMGKNEMINAFIANGPMCKFRIRLFEHPEKFQTPRAKNWIVHLDDLIDSYWVVRTLQEKEKLI